MRARLFLRILACLVMAAYIGATVLVSAATATSRGPVNGGHLANSGAMHHQDGPTDKMPCKGMPPGCATDLGCIFLVSLPAPDLSFVRMTAWSSVIYDRAAEGLRGRTIKPALGPPISLA